MEWISVKDRLPEMDGNDEAVDCRIKLDDGSETNGHYEDGDWWIAQPDPFVGRVGAHYADIEVTHWMALPEPPKQ